MTPLTARQQRLYAAIQQAVARGVSPTVRDLVAAAGFRSTSAVVYQLDQLAGLGLIQRTPGIARGILVVDRPAVVAVPLIGRIAAGAPIPVPDEAASGAFAETVPVSTTLVSGRTDDLFALRVTGHSMIDALIDDGDIVILRRAQTAENGATVAVWLEAEQETTLKRYYHEGARIRLQPANATIAPFYHDPANVTIQGQLVGVLRPVA